MLSKIGPILVRLGRPFSTSGLVIAATVAAVVDGDDNMWNLI